MACLQGKIKGNPKEGKTSRSEQYKPFVIATFQILNSNNLH